MTSEITSNDVWCLYVILNERGHSYVGITKGPTPDRRIAEHNSGKGARRTRGQGPWRLIYCENEIAGHGEALRRERAVKSDRRLRERLKRGAIAGRTSE